ncbi:hypothetical protein SDC9_197738 [bioreactor metagenome]|uniref:Uncharacterized protein n=1 Tax=bioreactor metagenome TaxID=1076179 RepID=A0A645IGZ2_9ZZZZ
MFQYSLPVILAGIEHQSSFIAIAALIEVKQRRSRRNIQYFGQIIIGIDRVHLGEIHIDLHAAIISEKVEYGLLKVLKAIVFILYQALVDGIYTVDSRYAVCINHSVHRNDLGPFL